MSEAEFFLTVFAMAGVTLLAWPLVRALAERIRHKHTPPSVGDGVVAELQEIRREIAELSERMDFTERLLAKQRDSERLAPPRS
jgi:hypothetical protein